MSTETGSVPAGRRCERCGTLLSAAVSDGLCPACLLVGGLDFRTRAAPAAPGRNASTLAVPVVEQILAELGLRP